MNRESALRVWQGKTMLLIGCIMVTSTKRGVFSEDVPRENCQLKEEDVRVKAILNLELCQKEDLINGRNDRWSHKKQKKRIGHDPI